MFEFERGRGARNGLLATRPTTDSHRQVEYTVRQEEVLGQEGCKVRAPGL